jgi:hypothetical protein
MSKRDAVNETFLIRVLGVTSGYGVEGNAIVFGRRVCLLDGDGTITEDAEAPSCSIRVMDVPRRVYMRLERGATTAQVDAAIWALESATPLKVSRSEKKGVVRTINNAFGDAETRGYGAVRCLKAFYPRKSRPMSGDVGWLGGSVAAALCRGTASSGEEVSVARRLNAGTLALVEGAMPADARVTTARLEYRVGGIKSITGLPGRPSGADWKWRIDAACLTVHTGGGTEGEFALSVAFTRSEFAPHGDDVAWVEPTLSRPHPCVTSAAGAGAVSALTAVHEAIEAVDPDVIVFKTAADLRALQGAVEATGIGAIGFAWGIKQTPGGWTRGNRAGRRGVCVMADWEDTEYVPDQVSGAEDLARRFEDRRVAWSALVLARASRATLFDALTANMPRLSDRLLLSALRDARIAIPDWETDWDATDPEPNGKGARYEGGLVLDAVCGLHRKPVYVVDFKGLYPSLVMEHGICFTNRPSQRGEIATPEKMRVLPAVMRTLAGIRAAMQLLGDNEAASADAVMLKLLGNATLGKFGQRGARFECVEIAEEITRAGRCTLDEVVEAAKLTGLPILYGDTDSAFVGPTPGVLGADAAMVRAEVDSLVSRVNGKKRFVRLRIEKATPCMLIVGKKQYAFLDECGRVEAKGLEMVKANYPPITRACCGAALRALLVDGLNAVEALAAAVAEYGRAADEVTPWVFSQRYKSRGGDEQICEAVSKAVAAGVLKAESGDLVRLLFVPDARSEPALICEGLFSRHPMPVHLRYCARRFVIVPLSKILAAAGGGGTAEVERKVSAAMGFALPSPPPPPQPRAVVEGGGGGSRVATFQEDPYVLQRALGPQSVAVPCPVCCGMVAVALTREAVRCGAVCPSCEIVVDEVPAYIASLLAGEVQWQPGLSRRSLLGVLDQADMLEAVREDMRNARITLPFTSR